MKDWLKSLKLNETTINTVLGFVVVLLTGVLIFNYLHSINKTDDKISSASTSNEETATTGDATVKEVASKGLPGEYVVKTGDSLWSIAVDAYGSGYNWTEVYNANKESIKNVDVLWVGTKLTLPDVQPKLLTPTAAADEPVEHTVIKGDNLWNLSLKYCGSGFAWSAVAAENNLPNPRLIEPGLKLRFVCK